MNKMLKEEVLVDLYKKIIEKSFLIKRNFSDQTIKKLCTKIKEQKYAPESPVIQSGEQANRLLFVLSGSLESHIHIKSITF